MAAHLKSMIHIGDLLSSHFDLDSEISCSRERRTNLLLLRFQVTCRCQGARYLHSGSGTEIKGLATWGAGGGRRGFAMK